jgi:hypothetical protein
MMMATLTRTAPEWREEGHQGGGRKCIRAYHEGIRAPGHTLVKVLAHKKR